MNIKTILKSDYKGNLYKVPVDSVPLFDLLLQEGYEEGDYSELEETFINFKTNAPVHPGYTTDN